jgi:hypothetical protein
LQSRIAVATTQCAQGDAAQNATDHRPPLQEKENAPGALHTERVFNTPFIMISLAVFVLVFVSPQADRQFALFSI